MISVEAARGLVVCALPGSNGTPHRTGASSGCERWEREPGIDDDDWNPVDDSRIAPYVPPPLPAARSRGNHGWWTEPPRPRRTPKIIPVVPVHVPPRDPFGGMYNWDEEEKKGRPL